MADLTPRALWQIDRLDLKRYRWYLGRGLARLFGAVFMGLVLAMHLRWPDDVWRVVGAVGVSLVASLLLRFHLRQVSLRTTTPRNAERLIWTTALCGVFGVQVLNLLIKGDPSVFPVERFLVMAPLAAQAMLTAALIGPATGIVGLTLTVVLIALFGAVPTEMLAACWLAGAVGCHTVNRLKRRSDLFRALSVQVAVHVVLATVTAIVAAIALPSALLGVAWAALAAVVALSIFWFGVAVFEKVFGIVSDWTLLELCSPENSLMHELNLRAPGTYAHSVGVGNLAETAAREIGANAVLVRAMAYYHDIGKLARPGFFVENQMGANVHDDMPPSLSAKVIAAHVKDGVEMAHNAKLPRAIVDGIRQHHGTTLITYFYHRALREGGDSPGLEESYRYDGPKPQSREAAILHLADMVEAASRTVRNKAQLEDIVHGLIENSRADGQLDECDLTFRELAVVRESFIRTLSAVRHERIAYPGQPEQPTTHEPDSDPERLRRIIEA
jgi:putative nucleotidyltransferase with HDIG domain